MKMAAILICKLLFKQEIVYIKNTLQAVLLPSRSLSRYHEARFRCHSIDCQSDKLSFKREMFSISPSTHDFSMFLLSTCVSLVYMHCQLDHLQAARRAISRLSAIHTRGGQTPPHIYIHTYIRQYHDSQQSTVLAFASKCSCLFL
jgi:hypothetical protein